MNMSDMCMKILLLVKPGTTNITLEGFVTRVNSFVVH